MRCDGHPDCRDRSDEESCTEPPQCTTKLRCPQSQECLLEEWVCDREQDCKDGSDEKVGIFRLGAIVSALANSLFGMTNVLGVGRKHIGTHAR